MLSYDLSQPCLASSRNLKSADGEGMKPNLLRQSDFGRLMLFSVRTMVKGMTGMSVEPHNGCSITAMISSARNTLLRARPVISRSNCSLTS